MKNNSFSKVSVLVPAYNEEHYITQTLEAVMQQDYPFYEVIVVDNASTDATAHKVRNFINKHPYKNVQLVCEMNKGTGFARECGRQAATGEIIAQLDADCLPSTDWISKGVQLLTSKNLVAITGPYYYYESPFIVKSVTLISQLTIVKMMNVLAQWFNRGGVIIGGNAFIKASVLEKAGGYNTALSFYGDDVDIAQNVSKFGRILFANKLLMKTSSRRYSAQGFFKVQSKYNKFFFDAVLKGQLSQKESVELYHPR